MPADFWIWLLVMLATIMIVFSIIGIVASLIERFPSLGYVVGLLFMAYIVIGIAWAVFSFITSDPNPIDYPSEMFEGMDEYGPMAR
jgi:hypothetical protein